MSLPRAIGSPTNFTDSLLRAVGQPMIFGTRCSAAHKKIPEHGIKVRSKPEFDVCFA